MSTKHIVARGECLAQIAHRYGFHDFRRIYDHPDNAALKKRRPDPNLLFPGDEIVVPDKEQKRVSIGTGSVHRFVIKRPTRRIHLRVRDFDRTPYRDKPYKLWIDDALVKEDVAADGEVEATVPVDARAGRIEIGDHEFEFEIGALNPVDETDDEGRSGLLGRLYGLGYDVDLNDAEPADDAEADDEDEDAADDDAGDADADAAGPTPLSGRTRAAIRWFQRDHQLTVTGELTDETRSAILDAYGA